MTLSVGRDTPQSLSTLIVVVVDDVMMISSSGIMIDTFEVMSLFMSLITRYRHSLSLSASQQKDCSVKKEKHDANRKKEKHQSEADFITGLDLITDYFFSSNLFFLIFDFKFQTTIDISTALSMIYCNTKHHHNLKQHRNKQQCIQQSAPVLQY